MRKALLLASLFVTASATNGFAVSEAVKKACDSDYAAYCSAHKVGSSELKSCMRAHRKMLTDACVKALGKSDEVSQQDIETYKRESKGK
jgi:hypothetical protein